MSSEAAGVLMTGNEPDSFCFLLEYASVPLITARPPHFE